MGYIKISEDLVKEILYDNLKANCENHHNCLRSSFYGSDWGEDGTGELEIYKKYYDPYNIQRVKIDYDELLDRRCCGQSPMLTLFLCHTCKVNLKKIKFFTDNENLAALASDWYINGPE